MSVLCDYFIRSIRRVLLWFLFFQAEDGIRDLVRSRGLGDVYKRQERGQPIGRLVPEATSAELSLHDKQQRLIDAGLLAVSYTHLTLPTSDLV